MLLQDLAWPEVKALDFDELILLFPTGSFEQHGPHLPLTTDTDIVSAIAEEVARVGGNITDLTTRLSGELYLLVAEVDLPAGVQLDALRGSLDGVAAALGVGVALREVESDDL